MSIDAWHFLPADGLTRYVRRTLAKLRLVRMRLRREGKLSLAGARYDMPHNPDAGLTEYDAETVLIAACPNCVAEREAA